MCQRSWRVGVGLVGMAMVTARKETSCDARLLRADRTVLQSIGESALPATSNVDLAAVIAVKPAITTSLKSHRDSLAGFESSRTGVESRLRSRTWAICAAQGDLFSAHRTSSAVYG